MSPDRSPFSSGPGRPDASMQEFVRLYAAHTQHLRSYILCLVPHWADAEDLLQDTASIMWSKFGDFVPGTDFVRWGCRIARLVVANHYRKQKVRQRQMVLDSDLIEAVARAAETDPLFHEDFRIDALQRCLRRLRVRDQQLIRWRYEAGSSVRRIAERINRSIDAVYKALGRIHQQLLSCVETTLAQEERRWSR